MSKAPGDGIYTTTDEHGIVHRFKVNKGDAVPEGATFVDPDAAEEPIGEQPAPRQRRATTGPSETTAANGPSQAS